MVATDLTIEEKLPVELIIISGLASFTALAGNAGTTYGQQQNEKAKVKKKVSHYLFDNRSKQNIPVAYFPMIALEINRTGREYIRL